MSQHVRGAIARSAGAPVEITTIVIPEPGPGEVVVDISTCGVCRTDLHYINGEVGTDYPYLLGHEAAGMIESVGPGVTSVVPGDFVVLNWRAVCGECRSCRRGRPQYCFASRNATQSMTLVDGTELTAALGIGAFADKTLVAAAQTTKVDPAASPAAVGLLGCGVSAGIGAAIHTGGVRPGDTVAVFGCGTVGNAAIIGSLLAGAGRVIAVARDPRKLDLAREFGATDLVDSSIDDPVRVIRDLTGGFGADVCIEAVGHPDVFEQAFYARDHAGTVVQVGVPTAAMTMPPIPMAEFFGRGGALKPSWYGDTLPERDIPIYTDLYMQGRLDLDRFVSEKIELEDLEEAFTRMERGEVLRSVVVL